METMEHTVAPLPKKNWPENELNLSRQKYIRELNHNFKSWLRYFAHPFPSFLHGG